MTLTERIRDKTDTSKWLDNCTLEKQGDLGYWVGYRIAKSLFQRSTDKREASRLILPVGRALGDARPGEPRENALPSLILPLAVKVNSAPFKSSASDQEATGRRSVVHVCSHRAVCGIEGAKAEALDDRCLIGSLEEFQ